MADDYLGRKLAEFVRLEEDVAEPGAASFQAARSDHRDAMLRHGVLISSAMTPRLEARLQMVCEKLGIHRAQVTAFAYNSADVQADCLIDSPNSCVLRFSSGLINLLDGDEFRFVAGHELGHFLLGHRAGCHSSPGVSSERFIVERARELSADRIGFLATDSIESSIRAIIKTASGLGNEHIRFDVSSFVAQADLISETSLGEARTSSHPSMLVRSRALLWFSMAIRSLEDVGNADESDVQRVDQKVLRDLNKYVDGHIRAQKDAMRDDIALWKAASLIFESGAFGSALQRRFQAEFGDENLTSLKSFFSLYAKDALSGEISKRLSDARMVAHREFPSEGRQIEEDGVKRAYSACGQ